MLSATNRKFLFLFLLIISFISAASGTYVPTVDINTPITIKFDKSTLPAKSYIWNGVINGYNINDGSSIGTSWFTCKSATNTSTGACSRQSLWSGQNQVSKISLRFIEKRSKLAMNISLNGQTYPCQFILTGECKHNGWFGEYVRIQDGVRPQGHNTKKLYIYFTDSDLANIPAGGIWEGKLILEQRAWVAGAILAHWTANITLDVTDRNNGAIYLPAFGKADALVDLNLRTRPLSTAPGGEVSGSTVIDTCLYDGYNSNNAWLQVTLSDRLPAYGRAADIFSVVKTGTNGSLARDRVDYRVAMDYNGSPVTMENGKVRTLSGVNTALIRPVALPGFSVPVVCTPAPLTLTVQPFAKASKSAGRYSGTLRVNLAAQTLAP